MTANPRCQSKARLNRNLFPKVPFGQRVSFNCNYFTESQVCRRVPKCYILLFYKNTLYENIDPETPEAETFFRIYFCVLRICKCNQINLDEKVRHTLPYNLEIVIKIFQPEIGRKIRYSSLGVKRRLCVMFFIQLVSLFSRKGSLSPSYSSILTIRIFCFKRLRNLFMADGNMVHKH